MNIVVTSRSSAKASILFVCFSRDCKMGRGMKWLTASRVRDTSCSFSNSSDFEGVNLLESPRGMLGSSDVLIRKFPVVNSSDATTHLAHEQLHVCFGPSDLFALGIVQTLRYISHHHSSYQIIIATLIAPYCRETDLAVAQSDMNSQIVDFQQ
mmetsp:Transcript_4787/g.7816  ORF Transcript_4787/g.7816 Transcript_4787/m.7816 type:complete len:153 (-) Transcript_4787:550-1008(-)